MSVEKELDSGVRTAPDLSFEGGVGEETRSGQDAFDTRGGRGGSSVWVEGALDEWEVRAGNLARHEGTTDLFGVMDESVA